MTTLDPPGLPGLHAALCKALKGSSLIDESVKKPYVLEGLMEGDGAKVKAAVDFHNAEKAEFERVMTEVRAATR